MMKADIKYSFTIEVGPLLDETFDDDFNYGFHVSENKIEYIAERAYIGIREYLRTFVEQVGKRSRVKILKTCSENYDELIDTFNGYWS